MHVYFENGDPMKTKRFMAHKLVLYGFTCLISQAINADTELPLGDLTGCPFIHQDKYDVGPLIHTLKTQIATKIDNRKSCKEEIQNVVSNLTPLQDFYKSIDPSTKQKITKSVYANALKSLYAKKLEVEMYGDTLSLEYSSLLSQISLIESSDVLNEIELQTLEINNKPNLEASYRNQIISHTSNVLNAYSSTARNNPQCTGKMGGWQVLSSVLSGVSVGMSLGLNPTSQMISAASAAASQLVVALQDSKIRSAYNDLIKIQNYKTLACTYYSIKKTSCEYLRAFKIAENPTQLREFIRNQFSDGRRGEYEKFFVNQSRINSIGNVFSLIAQMGSPLTLDQELLNSYLKAKGVDFISLGNPPSTEANDQVIKIWLIRARAFGVQFNEIDFQNNGQAVSLPDQLTAAIKDIKNKEATITSAEALIRENLSFLDLRKKISSDSPGIKKDLRDLLAYLEELNINQMIDATDKSTIKSSIRLLTKLDGFLKITLSGDDDASDSVYEAKVVKEGGIIFEELARGSVAQLTRQSVLALAGKGVDRLTWAFGVIRNAYMNRDEVESLPTNERFSEYQKNNNILSEVMDNHTAFYGAGATFRNEEFFKSVASFEKSFKKEMLDALKLSMNENIGWSQLRGKTAAHLCALYAPVLENLAKKGDGVNRASRTLDVCRTKYLELDSNKLVSDKNFKIDYMDECTYFEYSRQSEIQNLLARLQASRR